MLLQQLPQCEQPPWPVSQIGHRFFTDHEAVMVEIAQEARNRGRIWLRPFAQEGYSGFGVVDAGPNGLVSLNRICTGQLVPETFHLCRLIRP